MSTEPELSHTKLPWIIAGFDRIVDDQLRLIATLYTGRPEYSENADFIHQACNDYEDQKARGDALAAALEMAIEALSVAGGESDMVRIQTAGAARKALAAWEAGKP